MGELRRRRLQVGGLHAAMIEAGPQDAREAVVFVHGNPGSSSDWQALVAATGEFARAVAVDMPGFGQADKPREVESTAGGYAAFLQAAMDELQVGRVRLLLHAFGGPVVLRWGV